MSIFKSQLVKKQCVQCADADDIIVERSRVYRVDRLAHEYRAVGSQRVSPNNGFTCKATLTGRKPQRTFSSQTTEHEQFYTRCTMLGTKTDMIGGALVGKVRMHRKRRMHRKMVFVVE